MGRRQSTPQQRTQRARMILGAAEGKRNAQMAHERGACVDTVRTWRMRWIGQAISLEDLTMSDRLADLPRPGQPGELTAEQTCQIMALACEQPKERSISHWTGRETAEEDGMRHGAHDLCSPCRASLPKKRLHLHLIRSWFTPPVDPKRKETIRSLCQVSRHATIWPGKASER